MMKNIFKILSSLCCIGFLFVQSVIANPDLQIQISCDTGNGTFTAIASGGAVPYTYFWSTGETTASISGVAGELYTVSVYDGNQCFASASIAAGTNISLECQSGVSLTTSPFLNALYVSPSQLINWDYASCDADFALTVADPDGLTVAQNVSNAYLECVVAGEYSYDLVDNTTGANCSGTFTIADNPPVPVCINLSSALLDQGSEVELYAIDFDAGSYDGNADCDNPEPLRFTFTDTPPDLDPDFDSDQNSSSRIFGCDEFNASLGGSFPVTIYVWDAEDNFNACITNLNIIENTDSPCVLDGDYFRVVQGVCQTGAIGRYSLNINGGTTLDPLACLYEVDADNLNAGGNVLNIEDEDPAVLNGTSTLDLVIMQRGFVFGFATEWEAISSDLDSDQAISTLDMVLIRRLILGIETGDDITKYKVARADHDFTDFNPYAMGNSFSSVDFQDSEFDDTVIELVIIGSGDLNNSGFFAPEGEDDSSRSVAQLEYKDQYVKAGELVNIDFTLSSGSDIEAATFGIGLESGFVKVFEDNGNDMMTSNLGNRFLVSYLTPTPTSEVNFSMQIEVDQDGLLSEMLRLDNVLDSESINSELSKEDIVLVADETTNIFDLTDQSFAMYPNPAQQHVNILFEDKLQGEDKRMTLMSYDGKTILETKTSDNQISIPLDEILVSGFYFVKVNIGDEMIQQKLIIQK